MSGLRIPDPPCSLGAAPRGCPPVRTGTRSRAGDGAWNMSPFVAGDGFFPPLLSPAAGGGFLPRLVSPAGGGGRRRRPGVDLNPAILGRGCRFVQPHSGLGRWGCPESRVHRLRGCPSGPNGDTLSRRRRRLEHVPVLVRCGTGALAGHPNGVFKLGVLCGQSLVVSCGAQIASSGLVWAGQVPRGSARCRVGPVLRGTNGLTPSWVSEIPGRNTGTGNVLTPRRGRIAGISPGYW